MSASEKWGQRNRGEIQDSEICKARFVLDNTILTIIPWWFGGVASESLLIRLHLQPLVNENCPSNFDLRHRDELHPETKLKEKEN